MRAMTRSAPVRGCDSHSCVTPGTGRRGAMLVLIALLLVLFLGLVAFYVDVAYMQLCRTQLRIAADAAARASGEALSREQDLEKAREAAKEIAARHRVAGEPLILADSDVMPGSVAQQPDGSFDFTAGGTPANGLQITGRRTRDAPSGAVSLFFGKLFGFTDYETAQRAVVVRLDRDICLVVDRSSSMKLYVTNSGGNIWPWDPRWKEKPRGVGMGPNYSQRSRWAALVDAVDVFIDALYTTEPIEHVALVSYASDMHSNGVQNNASDIDQALTANPTLVTNGIDAISNRVFNGYTEIGTGMEDGIDVLMQSTRPFAVKTMIVLTDGIQNAGPPAVDVARDARAAGITVHTITFSDGADIEAMQEVAAEGGGQHFHAPDEASLKAAFYEIALTLPVLLTE